MRIFFFCTSAPPVKKSFPGPCPPPPPPSSGLSGSVPVGSESYLWIVSYFLSQISFSPDIASRPSPHWDQRLHSQCLQCQWHKSGRNFLELRKFSHFHILKLLFLLIFCWYFRYFVGTNDMLVGSHVPTNFQMYQQNYARWLDILNPFLKFQNVFRV